MTPERPQPRPPLGPRAAQVPVLDQDRLLRRFSGRRDIVLELYQLFLEQLPGQRDQLQQAHQNGDMDDLFAKAHALKGACVTIAADICSSLAGQLNQAAQARDAEAVDSLLLRLGAGLEDLRRALMRLCLHPPQTGPDQA
ncbi:MAG: Hpt domain-containing protein [Desulfovibrionaceae bacterium]